MPSSHLFYPELIKESEEELLQLEKSRQLSYVKDRVRFIRYLKEGIAKSQAQAGSLIGLQSRQSQNLWKLYQQKGLEGLLQARKATYLGKLSSVELSRLLQRLDQDDMMSQKQVKAYLEAEMGKTYSQPAIHYLFRRLKVKLKTGRPVNVSKDKAGQEVFKKMPDLQQAYGKKQIYFTHEMRYGTRTASKRRWSRQGRRPICKVKIGYQWGYLFVALCPATADVFACYCSHLDKACFKYFIKEFDQHLQAKAITSSVLLIGDKATAHQQSLLLNNIHWQSLPTACPELNPVERFFEELRKILANRIFEDKEQIEQCLTFWINEYQKQPEQIMQLTQFTWLNYAR